MLKTLQTVGMKKLKLGVKSSYVVFHISNKMFHYQEVVLKEDLAKMNVTIHNNLILLLSI